MLARRCLTQMGTGSESFVELTERIGRKTGGLSVSPFLSDVRGQAEPLALVMISGKAMADKAGDLLELFRDVLLTARLDDCERFKQVGGCLNCSHWQPSTLNPRDMVDKASACWMCNVLPTACLDDRGFKQVG